MLYEVITRDNGTMIEYLRQAPEDPNRPGYADPEYMTVAGRLHRKVIYGSHNAHRHPRNNFV